MSKQEYQTISKRARTLLNRSEGFDVEFKESVGQMRNEDLVAFANSLSGGTILLGVEEVKRPDGRQQARVVGCDVGDRERGSIMNRAESCVPPVEIELYVENLSRKPFYRVEIPSGSRKPYSTSGGTYKIRGDGQNKPLLPGRLLAMFMEQEGQEFLNRFRAATQELDQELGSTKRAVLEEVQQLLESLMVLQRRLSQTYSAAADAHSLADDAMYASDRTLGYSVEIHGRLNEIRQLNLPDIETKLDSILEHFQIEDPVISEARRMAWREFESKYEGGLRGWDLLHSIEFVRAPRMEIYRWYKEFLKDTGREDKELESH